MGSLVGGERAATSRGLKAFFVLPSAEHRAHIRRFLRSTSTDEEDVALRGFVAWKRLNHRLMAAAQAVESGTDRSGKKPRKVIQHRLVF